MPAPTALLLSTTTTSQTCEPRSALNVEASAMVAVPRIDAAARPRWWIDSLKTSTSSALASRDLLGRDGTREAVASAAGAVWMEKEGDWGAAAPVARASASATEGNGCMGSPAKVVGRASSRTQVLEASECGKPRVWLPGIAGFARAPGPLPPAGYAGPPVKPAPPRKRDPTVRARA